MNAVHRRPGKLAVLVAIMTTAHVGAGMSATASVIETELNTLGVAEADLSQAPAYRRATRTFRTDSYYAKGLLESERIDDVQDLAQPRPVARVSKGNGPGWCVL